jgi:hypothetical protein
MSSSHADRVDCFSVYSTADPSALPRIFEVFSLFSLVPSRCHTTRQDDDRDQLVVDLQIDGLPEGEAQRVVKRLGRVVTVTSVLWSERRATMRAA